MKKDVPHVLLINPWIYDFAAFDFWAKPLGLLMLGAILRRQGYAVSIIDCLDRFHPGMADGSKKGNFGKGHYFKTPVSKPKALYDVPRTYSRYGLPTWLFRQMLEDRPPPDVVLVTSLMTYWYPGVFTAIRMVRDRFPKVPVFLGGIYATLCREHAFQHSGADYIIEGEGETAVSEKIGRLTGFYGRGGFNREDFDTYPYPCMDLQSGISYIPLLTGRGCPFQCRYCASGVLSKSFSRRSPDHVVAEITYWHEKYGVIDFAFYDDALLVDSEDHILPILEKIVKKKLPVRFHTPNALHIRLLSQDIASLMFRAGFKTVRLGLETAFFSTRKTLDRKLGPMEFERAATHLKKAGFDRGTLGAYLLFGLPGQDIQELEASVHIVKACGVRPVLAQYSPIPHTALWDTAVASSRYDLASDPIFHNNSIFPCQKTPFSWTQIAHLKELTHGV
jgi:radical SAM superfamily enzyme YgiQ (UPF0313 family)